MNQFLPALIDGLGVGIVRLRLLHTRRRPLEVGFGLLGGRLGAREPRALFAVIEAGQHGALGDAVADIGAKLDQHARNLEADLGCDAGLDSAEAKHLNQYVAFRLRDLHIDRTEKQCPRNRTSGNDQREHNGQQKDTSTAHGILPLPGKGTDRLHCRF